MNIFIAGLNYNISDSELSELFAAYGEVSSARVIKDRQTGRSKGYGFAEMTDDEAAKKAIEELNGQEIKGRAIVVSEARPKTDAPRNNYNNRRY
jgi:RNA recognition motif-containing protein